MLRLCALLAVLALVLHCASSLEYDPTTPLLLDAYLDNSTSQAQGRNLSRVISFPTVYSSDSPTTPTTLPFTLHSGYFSITPTCSLFFQLFSPDAASTSPFAFPLIVFLAGGPGVSATWWSLYGGHSPLTFTASPTPRLLYHNQSWAEDAHVLLIDSPISVGYSHCASNPILAANNSEATAQLVTFMHKFFTLYPAFTAVPTYIAGHSYGGRYAPDLAAALSPLYNTIAGVIVESGLTQSYLSFSTCEAVYQQGLFNTTERHLCNAALIQLNASVEAKDEATAGAAVDTLTDMWDSANSDNSWHDWIRTFNPFDTIDAMIALITAPDMRLALHTGSSTLYAPYSEYSFTDYWSGESLTALDVVLSASSSGRVLYYASNKEGLHGSSAERLLAASQYSQKAGWEQVRPEALRQLGSSETRGLLKRDGRLWCATLYNANHAGSSIQPALVRQLVANFIKATTTTTFERDQTVASTLLKQWQKLLPPINRHDRPQPVLDVSSAAAAVDVSPAVYLTPYLSLGANGPALAQQASAVTLPDSSILAANSTHSGYITIDSAYNSHSFFWFLPSLDHNASAPLILHLSGGPGISSMAMGFLYQHGPFAVNHSSSNPLHTVYRADNYNEHSHVLYVDNPIGTGYSYTEDARGFRNDSRQVADDLYELLRQFFVLFPAYRSCRLYVHGVSYAGHFLPTLGAKIHRENMRRGAAEQMAFEGLLIASGWMDPASQTAEEVAFYQSIGRMDLTHTDQLVGCDNTACDLDFYNYVHGDVWEQQEAAIMAYLSHPLVVSALHAGERGLAVQSFNGTVSQALTNDPSVKTEVELLLASGYYQVAMYTAEYDVVCAASGVTSFIASLDYTRSTGWEHAVSKVWWPQPARPAAQSRQPPHTSPLQPWQPQPQGIWWSSSPHFTLHHAMVRFAGHLIEQTHLYQAGQIVARVQSWPALPKPAIGGDPSGDETEGFFHSGAGRAFIALLVLAVVFGAGALLYIRAKSRGRALAGREGAGHSSLSRSLLDDGEQDGSRAL